MIAATGPKTSSWAIFISGVTPTITVGTNGRILADASVGNVDVDLPTAAAGLEYHVLVVDGTNGVDLTPAGGDQVNGGGAGTPLAISVVGRYIVTAIDATDWLCHGPIAVA